jgi:hypothetical protein
LRDTSHIKLAVCVVAATCILAGMGRLAAETVQRGRQAGFCALHWLPLDDWHVGVTGLMSVCHSRGVPIGWHVGSRYALGFVEIDVTPGGPPTDYGDRLVGPALAAIVFVTSTGRTYHRDGCKALDASTKPYPRDLAEMHGYTACRKCRP